MSNSLSEMVNSLEKVSSGLRINSAMDDPAGNSIFSNMDARVASWEKSIENGFMGIELLKTIESSMSEQYQMISHMKTLGVQASNDTYNLGDLQTIRREMVQIRDGFIDSKQKLTYNQIQLMTLEDAPSSLVIQVGIDNNSSSRIEMDFSDFQLVSSKTQKNPNYGFSLYGVTTAERLAVIDEDIGLGYSKGNSTFFNELTDLTKDDFQSNMRTNILGALDTVLQEIAKDIATVGAYQNRIQSAVDVALETKINLSYASS